MTKKAFDCIEMKRQIVSEAQKHVAGMSVAEKIAFYKSIGDQERAEQSAERRRHAESWRKTGTED